MAVIGNSSTQQAFTPAVDYFSGNGSTTAFTLSRPVASVAQVQVVVNNVAQNPSSAYTVSSNTITFTSAPSSGTNNIYVYYTSPITQVIAPGQGTVTATSMASSTGTGAGVFQTSPTLITPALGTPSALVLTNATGLPAAQLTGTQNIPKATLPTGSVLQVVSATTTATTTNTTTTPADVTGLTATITPSSASSKVLVMASTQWELFRSAIEVAGYFLLLRGSTTIFNQSANSLAMEAGLSTGSRIYLDGWYAPIIVDSPATTSATTYKVQITCTSTGSSGRMTVNNQGNNTQTSSIVLMEIAA
jgi:hypothetical protein